MTKHRPGTGAVLCPCSSQQNYADCCAPLHAGGAAPTAEALMRSRYSAYVLALEPYLLASWHASTRPAQLGLLADEQPQWLGLEIRRHEATGDDRAIVEFVGRYKPGGGAHGLHETSRFLREEGRWYYVDGDVFEKTPMKAAQA